MSARTQEMTTPFTAAGQVFAAWRSAADEVWACWDELPLASRATSGGAYDQLLQAPSAESRAATDLAALHWSEDVAAGLEVADQAA